MLIGNKKDGLWSISLEFTNTLKRYHTQTSMNSPSHTLSGFGHISNNEFCMDDSDPDGSNVRLSVVVFYGCH